MRWNDLSDGSIKTLLILVLLFANIAVALPHRRLDSQRPGVHASPRLLTAGFSAPSPKTLRRVGILGCANRESNSFRQSSPP